MTKYEQKITEVATDIKWLIEAHKETLKRLDRVNNNVAKATITANSNKAWVYALKWITGGLCISVLTIVGWMVLA